jgi:hypothetical protein
MALAMRSERFWSTVANTETRSGVSVGIEASRKGHTLAGFNLCTLGVAQMSGYVVYEAVLGVLGEDLLPECARLLKVHCKYRANQFWENVKCE